MKTIPKTTLCELIERYEVFFVDQFGVLRDDIGAYDGSIAALNALKDAGKTVVILSNSGRSGEYNARRLVALGFPVESFDHFVTSGDVAYSTLAAEDSPIRSGDHCLTISSGGDNNLAARLGLNDVPDGFEADLVIISGSEAESIPMEQYRALLLPAAARGLPCFCTNPDIHKLVGGTTAPGAGSIARLYQELGGQVRWLGKPHKEIYDYALSLVARADRGPVICVGDSVEHDILGAQGAGLDSVLVRTGVLSALGDEQISNLVEKVGAVPTFEIARFTMAGS